MIGIVDGVSHRIDLVDAVIVPNRTAQEAFGLTAPAEVRIRTALGAAQLVGGQVPVALSPNRPEALQAQVPPPPAGVRAPSGSPASPCSRSSSGWPRSGCGGALGATRRHIAGQFLLERTAVGLVGGLVGSAAGVVLTVAVSAVRNWAPVLDLRLAAGAPFLGALVGLAAGTYPALRASTIHSLDALRTAG